MLLLGTFGVAGIVKNKYASNKFAENIHTHVAYICEMTLNDPNGLLHIAPPLRSRGTVYNTSFQYFQGNFVLENYEQSNRS